MTTPASNQKDRHTAIIITIVLSLICIIAPTYYGFIKSGDIPIELEGWLQGIYVFLLAPLAFLVHHIKRPRSHAHVAVNADKNFWTFVTGPHICVLLFLGPPTVIFIAAMIHHGQKDLAVFAMAIVAIYIAAEHYASLEGQKDIVEKLGDAFDEQATLTGVLKTQVDSLAMAFRDQTILTEVLKAQVDSLANTSGTSYSQRNMFKAYGMAPGQEDSPQSQAERGIYAVYKYFDIDSGWWTPDVSQVWRNYFANNGDTLYNSLVNGKRLKVLFVTDMPFQLAAQPETPETVATVATPATQTETLEARRATLEAQFAKFIGLAWYCVVLDEAAKKLEKTEGERAAYNIVVATTSNWIHVVDRKVFQLVGTPPNDLRVRDLTFDIHLQGKDMEVGRHLVTWAIEDIVRVSRRGNSAHEYLSSVLAYKSHKEGWSGGFNLKRSSVEILISDLGFKSWVEGRRFNCPPEINPEVAKKLCCEILYEFMVRLKGGAIVGEEATPDPQDFVWEIE